MGDPWQEEGFGAENDWGEESVEADLEEELLESAELDDEESWDDELDEDHE